MINVKIVPSVFVVIVYVVDALYQIGTFVLK